MRDNQLGALVREKRKEIGITQYQLALRLGVQPAYLSQIETGTRRWPGKYTEALARELGVSEVALAVAAGLISDPALEVQAA